MKALNLWEWLNLNEHEQNESCKHRTIMLTANLLLALVLALVYTQNSMLEISQSNIWWYELLFTSFMYPSIPTLL
jgi:hypothetical protein